MNPRVLENQTNFNLEFINIHPWDKNFDLELSREMFNRHWHYPYIISIFLYLPCVYGVQKIMKGLGPMEIKIPLIVWNLSLALFSIAGFVGVAPEFVNSLMYHGFHHSICDNKFYQESTCFWMYLFMLSKIPELMDTLFLVLTKKKLLFLHVYHHGSVLCLCWAVWADGSALARWATFMNYGIHSLMYSYFALKAIPNLMRVPKWISMTITTLQILQMIFGSIVVAASYYARVTGRKCATTEYVSTLGLVLYISYLILFGKFFYESYCSTQSKRIKKQD